ncbi:unnamed protein product [Spirodela intermedia]|uniref:Uncharacterized protein n=1 Tax=Spirodela intermedia TaxID=51605 RepID=A0A7I8JCG0_SPIIN|nr:unnamed protein product [Spirodela intermedia]CAA6667878.1 unnamed protein product [Spirodela intermedia]
MKRICPRGEGKIHSSPSCAGGGSGRDAVAALNLLPAAVLALTAALGAEDREVLAYLVARSLQWPWPAAAAAEEEKAGRRRRRQLPSYCGCFECYTGYWFRWDSSPDRELIHRAIEGFEEHLASSEGRRRGGRRRHRRLGDRPERVTETAAETAAEGPAGEKSSSSSSEDDAAEERDQLMATVEVKEGSGGMNVAAAAAANYQHSAARGRRWRGVMGLFTSPLWSLWLPGV